ncbi:trypsin-like peptidase domain-containing protein [bacterium]|nr:trypsin-like peptidase domain-containing protein [bacterium]
MEKEYVPQTSQEQAIIKVVKETSPSVVGIVVTQYLPLLEPYYYEPFKEFEEFFGEPLFEFKIPQYRQKGVEKKESLIGTGFIVSEDGMILTNRHVVADETAEYTVLMTDGRKFPAKILAKDKIRDIAILKIENSEALPVAKLGDSKNLQIGQTVIAIGNALGEFQNTVSVGVISGLGRTITASGGGIIETLEDVIQTDAAINRGNSGGPLLNLKGEVVGINTAMSLEGENIGFAIPINQAKKDITQVKTLGKIVYPYLGVYYCLITDQVQEKYNLPVNYGAWIGRDKYCNPYDKAVIPGTAAEKAGLQRNDIILEFNGEKITPENSLAKIIMDYNPGDRVVLKVLRGEEEKIFQATLGEMSP